MALLRGDALGFAPEAFFTVAVDCVDGNGGLS